jgi:hypothetical protein
MYLVIGTLQSRLLTSLLVYRSSWGLCLMMKRSKLFVLLLANTDGDADLTISLFVCETYYPGASERLRRKLRLPVNGLHNPLDCRVYIQQGPCKGCSRTSIRTIRSVGAHWKHGGGLEGLLADIKDACPTVKRTGRIPEDCTAAVMLLFIVLSVSTLPRCQDNRVRSSPLEERFLCSECHLGRPQRWKGP